MTVRVPSGDAAFWQELSRVWVGPERAVDEGRFYDVEHGRAYRNRLVLKLAGLDDPSAVERLRGQSVMAAADDAPSLDEDVHYVVRLVGMEVEDEGGTVLGRVKDIMPTGGVDLLVVTSPTDDEGRETLIPLAREIVIEVCEERGRIRIRPPAGLLELNRR